MGRRGLYKLLNLISKDPQKYLKKPKKPTYNALKKYMSREGEFFDISDEKSLLFSRLIS